MNTELDELSVTFEADVVAAALLCQRVIPSMKIHGGTIINMSSSVVFLDPPGTVHANGWSFAYAAAKAGIDQLAGILNVELGDSGVRAFNVEPGFVAYGEQFEETLQILRRSPCHHRRQSVRPSSGWCSPPRRTVSSRSGCTSPASPTRRGCSLTGTDPAQSSRQPGASYPGHLVGPGGQAYPRPN